VPEPKTGKNRMHLDIVEAEATRLEQLGACRLEKGPRREELDTAVVRWIVMADPEGNEFCVEGAAGQDTGAGAAPPA
jgi:hypothetical protein